MNAVGIDVSNGESMMAALRPMDEIALLLKEYLHTEVGLAQIALLALKEDTCALMEPTERLLYYRNQSAVYQAEWRQLHLQGQDC